MRRGEEEGDDGMGGWARFFEKIGKLQVDYAAGVDALKRCTYSSNRNLSHHGGKFYRFINFKNSLNVT